MRRHMRSSMLIGRRQRSLGLPAASCLSSHLLHTLPSTAQQQQQRQWQMLAALHINTGGAVRGVSTWKLAAGGLQRKWKGIKQRTAWRFKTLKDKNTLIVFSADHQKEKEIHIKVPLVQKSSVDGVRVH